MLSRIFTLAFIFITLSGCSWIRDQPKDVSGNSPDGSSAFRSESLNLNCLKVMPQQLQMLFNGQYTSSDEDQEQIKQIWTCLDKSLLVFGTRVKGQTPGVYTSSELLQFANHYLPKDHQFTPDLTDAIFRLKKAVLGGSDTLITTGDQGEKDTSEIRRLRNKLNRFGEIILPLAPHLSSLLRPSTDSNDERRGAGQALNHFVMDFALLLEDSRNPLQWADLGKFIFQLELYTQKDTQSALTVVREQLPLYQYLKLMLVGGNELVIENTKWRPIFKSVSSFYSAFFMSTNTAQQMESLQIEIQSTEADQRRATEKITLLLGRLKNDQSLFSKKLINTLADRWAKILLLNAFLFPNEKGSLALKTFLDSEDLRRFSGYIIDEALKLQTNFKDIGLVQSLTYHLNSLIKGSADKTTVSGQSITALSIASLQDYALQLQPLFSNPSDLELIRTGIDGLKSLSVILIGRDSDTLQHSDLENLVQKLSDLYVIWLGENKKKQNNLELMGQSLDVILRLPAAYSISLAPLNTLLDQAQKIVTLVQPNPKTKIDWDLYRSYLKNGFKIKNLIYGKADNTIYSAQLKEIQTDLEPFRNSDDFAASFSKLATLLTSNLFAEKIDLDAFLDDADVFLPENHKIASFGFSRENIGLLKSILLGGKPKELGKAEYSEIARLAANLDKYLMPVTKLLPADFKPGLNTLTFSLADAGLKAFIEAKKEGKREGRSDEIRTADLKKFLYSSLKNAHYDDISYPTLDKFIIGLNQRVLKQDHKNPKSTTLPATLSVPEFHIFIDLLNNIKLSFGDLEQAFSGVDHKRPLSKSVLLEKLIRPETKEYLKNLAPIIDAETGTLRIEARNKKTSNHDYYYDDLAYKTVIYRLLEWVFPLYQIGENARLKDRILRLSHDDVVDILQDIDDLVFELKLGYKRGTPEGDANKRMQTINLFTQSGNGDEYIDINETTEFLTLSMGATSIMHKVRLDLVEKCYPEKAKKYETVHRFSITCITQNLFSIEGFKKHYGKVVPQLVEHYATELNSDGRDEMRQSMLSATKPSWTEDGSLVLDDLQTLTSIPFYTENIFERFDTNYDNILQFSEAMNAFPVFCREIANAAGPQIKGECGPGLDPFNVEAIYGYLLIYGHPPDVDGTFAGQVIRGIKFLNWARARWRGEYRDMSDASFRTLYRKDLLSIISALSSTIAPSSDSGAPEEDASLKLKPLPDESPGSR